MAISKFVLKTIKTIDRPAISGLMPTMKGLTVVLDLGANVECSNDNLVQFAHMGDIFNSMYSWNKKPQDRFAECRLRRYQRQLYSKASF